MTKERTPIPDWARREREGDLAWIRENLTIFWSAAQTASKEAGRGVIVVDTTVQPIPGSGHPFGYFPQGELQDYDDEDTRRMVREYDPAQEFVVLLLKPKGHTSSYRVRAIQGGVGSQGNGTH